MLSFEYDTVDKTGVSLCCSLRTETFWNNTRCKTDKHGKLKQFNNNSCKVVLKQQNLRLYVSYSHLIHKMQSEAVDFAPVLPPGELNEA